MSFTVNQTSAARVVRADHLTDESAQRLIKEFGVHPLDVERLSRVPERSHVETYRDQVGLHLVLPWPGRGRVVGVDVHLVLGPKLIIVVGDTPARSVANALRGHEHDNGFSSSTAIATDVIQTLIRDVVQALPQARLIEVNRVLQQAGQALVSFVDTCTSSNVRFESSDQQALALTIHRCKRAAHSGEAQPTPTSNEIRPQKYAIGYIAASVAVLLMTLIVRT